MEKIKYRRIRLYKVYEGWLITYEVTGKNKVRKKNSVFIEVNYKNSKIIEFLKKMLNDLAKGRKDNGESDIIWYF